MEYVYGNEQPLARENLTATFSSLLWRSLLLLLSPNHFLKLKKISDGFCLALPK
ncbi:MAG: hypothetical protein F6K24_20930 [Okeania sp. SIO2D1]|nr:hypothetical protein [Okeania sp. SIO2D1]